MAKVGDQVIKFEKIKNVVGTGGDDNFIFQGAKDGDEFRVVGGGGKNTIDLSNISGEHVVIEGNQIKADVPEIQKGHGTVRTLEAKFRIKFEDVQKVELADGLSIPILGKSKVAGLSNDLSNLKDGIGLHKLPVATRTRRKEVVVAKNSVLILSADGSLSLHATVGRIDWIRIHAIDCST